ncbi:MAG: radical SAM protein, partial [Calditrichia bacterium]|nr:radical SAM protein [Calditrichia bacterium]
ITNPKNMIKNINGLAFPEYSEDVYPAMKGNNKLKIIMIDDSRGCSNGCNFCLHPMKSGYIQRLRNPEGVVDEMERCKKLYGISVFKFAGSNTPKKLALGIAHEITKRNLRVKYTAFANARADITVGEFEALKNSGCFGLWFGVESGNQKILDNVMNKKITIGRLLEKMLNCKKAGIYASGSVIVPAPGETEKTKEDTLKFLVRSGIDSVIVEPAIIIPGTKWDTDSEKYNIEIMDRDNFFKEEMFYKMKLLYPPDLLKPCPYFKINGKLDKEIFKEAGNFVKRLEKNGIITQITVDTALIAQYAGLGTKEFRDQSRIYFINGDHNKIKQQVSYINSKLLN